MVIPVDSAEAFACPCGVVDAVSDDGYCSNCGLRLQRPAEDHIEIELSPLCAAVCDRGIAHSRNEDRAAVRECNGGYALVLCDGVSASRDAGTAAASVAESVGGQLEIALRNGIAGDAERIVREAIAAANEALSHAHPEEDNPPATTVVAALVADGCAAIAWAGDSRAYWIGSGETRQLTRDHSWPAQAHAITRWLGAGAGEQATADAVRFAISGPGVLLLCSDGVWDYAPDLQSMTGDGTALEIASRLVAFANAQGGEDNASVIVLRCEPETGNAGSV